MKALKLTARFIAFWLTISMTLGLASAAAFYGYQSPFHAAADTHAGIAWMLVTFCYAAVFAFVASRSEPAGIKLAAALGWAFFGITGLLSQVESLVFLRELIPLLPAEFILRIVLHAAMAAVLCPLLTLLFYRTGRSARQADARALDPMPFSEWASKLALAGAVYVAVYMSFGALVAAPLGGDAFSQFYRGLVLPAWFVPFQLTRGVIWASTAVPVLLLFRGPRWQAGLTVALMFAVFMGVVMIVPNPIFPDQVRWAHLVELCTSNFVNGWLVFFILTWKPIGQGERRVSILDS